MQTSNPLSPSDDSPGSFDQAVRTRAWDWLVALQRRLNVDLQLVDERGTPVLAATTPVLTDLARLLASGAEPLRAPLAAALRTRAAQAVIVESMQIVCVGLPGSSAGRGALVLARRINEGAQNAPQVRGELELIAVWLSGSIAAHLASAPVSVDGAERLAVLGRLLGDAATTGSDRDVVARLADVLAVWHDVDLFGYVDSGQGTLVREIALPGADLTRVPSSIDPALLPELGEVKRLAKGEVEALGISHAGDVLVARVPAVDGKHGWLLVMLARTSQDARRFGAYVAFAAQSAAQAAAASAYRVVGSMSGHLLQGEEDPQKALAAALEPLRESLQALSVGVVATAATGAPLLRVAVPGGAQGAPDENSAQIVVVRRVPDEYTIVLAVAHPDHRTVTPHERYVAGAACDLLTAWMRRVARGGSGIGERRAAGRSFVDIVERVAAQTLERGGPVSVIVLSDLQAAFHPGNTQRWVATIRGSLRAADLVGMLGEGEVALLLPDTAPEQARDVAARVEKLARDTGEFGRRTRLGIASRHPGEQRTAAIVQEARDNAAGRGEELAS